MKRKLIFLSSEYSKDVVDLINGYFEKGYEVERILDADCGYYIFLILKDCDNYKYSKKHSSDNFSYRNLIEEDNIPTWVETTTLN